MLFVNTRPNERAKVLTQALLRHCNVLELPLLELQAYPLDETMMQDYQQLGCASVIVVVSPTAARLGLAHLMACQISIQALAHIQWVAVGTGTAHVLKKAGISAHIPKIETSEGVLELPILSNTHVKCVAFWRGKGGRQFMMDRLKEKQVKILNFCLYQRFFPNNSVQILKNNIDKFLNEEKIYVCISSEASWMNWLKLCQSFPNIDKKCYYLTLGERLTGLVVENQSQQVQKIDNLHPHTIWHTIQEIS